MDLRENNKGMSLIELIISLAISAIIISIIIMIISTASNSFRRTNNKVNLQVEAQKTLNQLSNLAMEASSITEATTNPAPSLEDDKFIISSSPKSYAVLFIKNEKRIFLITGNSPSEVENVYFHNTEEFVAKYLMSEYVKDITIEGLGTNKVTFNLIFELDNDTYEISNQVKLRNAQ